MTGRFFDEPQIDPFCGDKKPIPQHNPIPTRVVDRNQTKGM